MNKDDKAYLRLILDACAKVASYTARMSKEAFLLDNKTQSAVIMQIQIIGELAKKVPDAMKDSIALPWKQMAGMRDFIAHDYFSLDLEGAWQTVERGIPEAAAKIREYLEDAK
jgi:uncharacterized protein with HEPN domain